MSNRWNRCLTSIAFTLALTCASTARAQPRDTRGRNTCITAAMFTHVVTGGDSYSTAIDHPSTNGRPEAMPIITPNWTPLPSSSLVPNYDPVGVWYDTSTQRWNIYNDDGAILPAGTAFNVRVGEAFAIHSPTPANSSYYFPFSSALPSSAMLLATASYNPGGAPTGSNNWSPLAVWYAGPTWNLAHSDGLPFYDANNGFHMADEPCAYAHQTTLTNIVGNDTLLDHPLANDNPKAIVLVTRVLGANGISSGQYPHHLAVHYQSGKWAIRGWDNDGEVMTTGATINVLVQAF